ncbi:MAG: REP-associated tyrosine transposase [Phycisphaerae bacterium]
MPNYLRWQKQGGTFFLTVVTYRRRPLFRAARNRTLLRTAFAETMERAPFEMFACVLLYDHFHCLWTLPPGDSDFPSRVSFLKSRFTRAFFLSGGRDLPVSKSRKTNRERGVWQARYWEHFIRDDDDLYRHRDYIHLNPVKHGYVTDPLHWPWSSIHHHIAMGWLNRGWPGSSPVSLPTYLVQREQRKRKDVIDE